MSGKTTHADALRDDVREVLRKQAALLNNAGRAFAEAAKAAQSQTDYVPALAAFAGAVLAMEMLEDVAKAAAVLLRAEILHAMQEGGASLVTNDVITVNTAKKPAFVDITDDTLVPAGYWTQPAKVIDRKLIKSTIETGTPVSGATLRIPNDLQLRITVKK